MAGFAAASRPRQRPFDTLYGFKHACVLQVASGSDSSQWGTVLVSASEPLDGLWRLGTCVPQTRGCCHCGTCRHFAPYVMKEVAVKLSWSAAAWFWLFRPRLTFVQCGGFRVAICTWGAGIPSRRLNKSDGSNLGVKQRPRHHMGCHFLLVAGTCPLFGSQMHGYLFCLMG